MTLREKAVQFAAWRTRRILSLLARNSSPQKRNRVLCIVTGGLGDKLMALPAVRHLRAEFPQSKITLLYLGAAPPFVKNEADQVVELPATATLPLLKRAAKKYDVCFVNSIGIYDVRCEVAAFATNAPDRRGPRFGREKATIYNHPFVFGESHETRSNFLGAGGTSEAAALNYPLSLPPEIRTLRPGGPDIILHPGSSPSGLVNRWPVENYAALAAALAKNGHRVAAIGSPAEKPLIEELQSKSGGTVQFLSDLTLGELATLLACTELVIANDSGIAHLAAAVGTQLITIMGANKPEKVAPIGKHVTLIGPRCIHGGCYNDPRIKRCEFCINRISVSEVLQTARSILHS